MRIRFVGPGAGGVTIRLVGVYRWAPDTGYVADVDADTAAELLTQPRNEFVVDSDDPLLSISGIGSQRAAELALAGIGSMADLAALNSDEIERLAAQIFGSKKQVWAWVRDVKKRLSAGRATDLEKNESEPEEVQDGNIRESAIRTS